MQKYSPPTIRSPGINHRKLKKKWTGVVLTLEFIGLYVIKCGNWWTTNRTIYDIEFPSPLTWFWIILLLSFQIPSPQHFLLPWLRTTFSLLFLALLSPFFHLLLLFFIPLPIFPSNIIFPPRPFLFFCCLFVYLPFSFPFPTPYSLFSIPFPSS